MWTSSGEVLYVATPLVYLIGHNGQLDRHYQVVYPAWFPICIIAISIPDMHNRHQQACCGRHWKYCALAPPLSRTWRLSHIQPRTSHRKCTVHITWPGPMVAASSRRHYRLRLLLMCAAHHLHSFDHSPEWTLLPIHPLRPVSNRHCWTHYRHTRNVMIFFVTILCSTSSVVSLTSVTYSGHNIVPYCVDQTKL